MLLGSDLSEKKTGTDLFFQKKNRESSWPWVLLQGEYVRVFLDNNLWDYLANNKIDLLHSFPKNNYDLFITTHGKYEIIQLVKDDKKHVREFALEALKSTVREDAIFGFYSDLFPAEYQRASGFGVGRYFEKSESLVKSELFSIYGTLEKRKESQVLFKQEADIELATRSKNSPVITFDANKPGPLLYALNKGWHIIPLDVGRSKSIPSSDFMQEIVAAIEVKNIKSDTT